MFIPWDGMGYSKKFCPIPWDDLQKPSIPSHPMGHIFSKSVPWDGMGWDGMGWDYPIPRGALIHTFKKEKIVFRSFLRAL